MRAAGLHLQLKMDMNRQPLRITSLKNDQVKNLVRLRNRRHRDLSGLIIIEEPLVLRQALNCGYHLDAVYFCPELVAPKDLPLLEEILAKTSESFELTQSVMDKVSYREKSEGILVLAPQVIRNLEDLQLETNPLLMVLEAVEKPGNLGAALRVADGAGADGIILCGGGTDLFNPNVLRASRGAFFSVPAVTAELSEVVAFLKERDIKLVAASPDASDNWDEIDLAQPCAIVLGTEHEGLSPQMLEQCDLKTKIPMLGVADSLNVTTSAAVLLYEAVRQRRSRSQESS